MFITCKCAKCHCVNQIEYVWKDEPVVCWPCSKGIHSGAFKAEAAPIHVHEGWYCCDERKAQMLTRMSLDECVMVPLPGAFEALTNPVTRLFCVTHGKADSPEHAVDTGPLATLD